MGDTARKSLVATTVAVAVIATALALWHLRLLVALLLLAIVIASAVRPGVEFLHNTASHARSVSQSTTRGS